MAGKILVVDDNARTRKLVRATLEAEGYSVLEASDGAAAVEVTSREEPDLVLQDFLLPDVDGFELVRRLRALPAAADVPILAFTGFFTNRDEARSKDVGFSGFLMKPVEPVRLVQTIRTYLPTGPAPSPIGVGWRVLVVDDDPIQRKLLATHLGLQQFVVWTAAGGCEALAMMKAMSFDAIVTDVLMPGIDGFDLCRAAREDPALADVPIVLTSAYFTEEHDRQLAEKVGADAFVVRTPGFAEVIEALRNARRRPRPLSAPPTELAEEHKERVIQQLEKQVGTNAALAQTSALQATQLAILSGVAAVLMRTSDVSQVLDEVLFRCLEASSAFTGGFIYLLDSEGRLVLAARRSSAQIDEGDAETFFGRQDLLRAAIELGESLRAPSPRLEADVADDLSRRARARALIANPIARDGAIVLAANVDLGDEWLAFARAIAVQVGQALALARAHASVAASEQRYRDLVEGLDAIVWEAEPARRGYSFVSRRAEDVLGYPVEQWLSEPDFWEKRILTEDRDRTLGAYEEALEKPRASAYEYRATTADGRTVWLHERVLAIDGDGKHPRRVRGLTVDVTSKKAMADQLAHAARVESIGALAAGIAHNINNILTCIAGQSELLSMHRLGGKALDDSIDAIRSATERGSAVTRQLLAYSRRRAIAPRVIDVNATLTEVARMLRSLLSENIEIALELSPDLHLVHADPVQMEQAILNLALNARDAMPDGGTLTIHTANIDVDEALALRLPGTTPGPHVEISVRDTGKGIAPDVLPHLFEPFFTTKGPGAGSGLGLATVCNTVKQAEGAVKVDSELGHGAVFRLLFPRAKGIRVEAPAPEVNGPGHLAGGSETILFVEDDEAVRELMHGFLGDLGYRLRIANDGVQALELAKTVECIDLLITDVVMPLMNGVELARRVRELRPQIDVLFVSGYSEGSLTQDGHIPAGVNFLEKPYSLEVMARRIREILERRAAAPPVSSQPCAS